ncbi:MAG: hypothetical protein ABIS36_02340 [Chryseolinea sp.]
MRFNILFFLILLGSAFHCSAQTADQIISKYITYIGGESAWKKVKTITASGEYNYGGMPFPFTSYSKAPNLYKLLVPFNGKYYAQGFDGQKGWKIDAFKNETKPTLLTGKEARALANEADVELLSPFIDYKSKQYSVALLEKDTASKKTCYVLRLRREAGEVEEYYFDDHTFALLMKKAIAKNTELQSAPLRIYYNDYRNIKGLRVPFQAVCESEGQTILVITTKEVSLDKPIALKQFQP